MPIQKIKEQLAAMNLLVEDWGGNINLMIFLHKQEKDSRIIGKSIIRS